MANVLSRSKQLSVLSALVEGMSIRSTERMTGVHRDTIMRLIVAVGSGCSRLMDALMRDLECRRLEIDELWAFVEKKQRHVQDYDDPSRVGDTWTYVAIDSETKLVPTFMVGKRDAETTNAFVHDLAWRMKNRVQVSTDGLRMYVEAIGDSFGNLGALATVSRSPSPLVRRPRLGGRVRSDAQAVPSHTRGISPPSPATLPRPRPPWAPAPPEPS